MGEQRKTWQRERFWFTKGKELMGFILPKDIRRQLSHIGVPHTFGFQIGNWAFGQRYKSADDVIYCQNGEVVSVRRKAKWIWRKDNGGDNSE